MASGATSPPPLPNPQVQSATELYVSLSGNDLTGTGTSTLPFRTVQRCRDFIRTINSAMNHDLNVYLRAGEYQLSDTVLFGAQDSGTNGYNVIYQSYPGETAVLSGGRTIASWVDVGGGIFRASAGGLRFRQLYVNGVKSIRARSPNVGSYYAALNWDLVPPVIYINASEISSWQHLDEVELVITRYWTQANLRVASFTVNGSTASVTIREPEWSNYVGNGISPQGATYYLENAYELLNADGEWHLNTTTDEIFYKPRGGEDMTTAVVTVPQVETLVRVSGTTPSPAHHIQFKGLTFAYSTWALPTSEGFVNQQAVVYLSDPSTASMPGSVRVDSAHNIRFERNIFKNLGASGLVFWSGVDSSVVIGNLVTDVAGSGIAVDQNLVANPGNPLDVCHGNTVTNNYITKIGREFAGSVGIFLGYTDATVVTHNELTDMPYTGISDGWGWTLDPSAMRANQIRYNHIWNVMNFLEDGGGIYTLSNQPGTLISDNYLHDFVRSAFTGNGPIAGVYLDEGTDYLTSQNNHIVNTPLGTFTHMIGTHNTIDETVASPSTVIANAGLEVAYQDIRP